MTEITYLAPSDTPASGSVTLTGTGTFSIPGVTATGDVTVTVDAAQLMEALMLSLSIQSLSLGAQQPPAASVSYPDPSNIQSVGADGWTATYFLSGETAAGTETWASDRYAFDPETPALAVQRSGYDANGDAATHVDLIAVNTEVRKPWSDFTLLDRTAATGGANSRVALSDWIYSGDVILDSAGADSGITNSSTAGAPLPQAMWLNPPHERIADAAAHPVRIFTDHRHARNGKPVAAVKVTATDGATTVTEWATLGTESWTASGLSSPVWRVDLDLSGLNDGAITLDATIYPWVGSAVAMSSLHPTAGSIKEGARTAHKGVVQYFAYVSASGNNATGVVSTDPATAQAAPFASPSAEMNTALIAAKGGSDPSGLVIRYESGTYARPGLNNFADAGSVPILLEPAPGASVTITTASYVTASLANYRSHWKGLTITDAGGAVTFTRGGGAADRHYVFEDCAFVAAGTVTVTGACAQFMNRMWLVNCTVSGVFPIAQLYGGQGKNTVVLGCDGVPGNSTWAALGSRGGGMAFPAAGSGRESGAGGIASFCHFTGSDQRIIDLAGAGMDGGGLGASISGTVVESVNTTASGPAVFLAADGNASSCRNINTHCTTIAGDAEHGRMNMLYLDGATYAPTLSMSMRFCVVSWCPSKSDVFAGENAGVGNDGVEYGNWPVIFRVGHRSNAMTDATYAQGLEPAPGPGSWSNETAYPGLQWDDLDPDWTDDQSGRTAGSGGGDYRPGASTELGFIPAGFAPFPVDHLGQAIPNDGSARIGALQPVAA